MQRNRAEHTQHDPKWRVLLNDLVEYWELLRDEWNNGIFGGESSHIESHDLNTEIEVIINRAEQRKSNKKI